MKVRDIMDAEPVTVTPEIVTTGSVGARNWPIVRTGPPPRMTVRRALAPTRLMLLSMVIPPANVPRSMRIVPRSR